MPTVTQRNGGRLARLGISAGFALAALFVSGNPSNAQNFKAPQPDALKATSATLAIKSPASNACPAKATMAGWISTSKPGQISYLLVRKGGSVAGPYTLEAVPSANGAMASFSRELNIDTAINAEYRLLVADGTGKVVSNWAPLKASCKIALGG